MKSKKQIIQDAAARLFRKKGYQGTSMQDIAGAVGVKAASLYNHIRSKQEILSELLLFMAHRFTEGMHDIETARLSHIEKLERLVALHVRLTVAHTDAASIITGEWVHLSEPNLGQYTRLRNNYEIKFKAIIDECKKEGYILETIDTEIALFSILSTLHWLYSWYNRHPGISPIELEKQLIQTLLGGLRKK